MKKIIKSIPVYLTVVMILCCSLVVPAFASSEGVLIDPYTVEDNKLQNGIDFVEIEGASCSFYLLDPGNYSVNFYVGDDLYSALENAGNSSFRCSGIYYCDPLTTDFVDTGILEPCDFIVSENMLISGMEGEQALLNGKCLLIVNSFEIAPSVTIVEPPATPGVYYQAFDMFAGFIYGEGMELTAEQNMVLTILATTAVLFVVVVPFLIVFFVLRLFR